MKKLLTLLGAMAIAGTTYGTVVTLFEDGTDAANWTFDSSDASVISEWTTVGGDDVLHFKDFMTATGGTGKAWTDVGSDYTGMIKITYDLTLVDLGTSGSSSYAFKMRLGDPISSSSSSALSIEPRMNGQFQVKRSDGTSKGNTLVEGNTYGIEIFANFGDATDTLEGTTLAINQQQVKVYDSLGVELYDTGAIANYHSGVNFAQFGFQMDTSVEAGEWYVDSIQLTAVPEPSTYAALAGLLALGFAASRRRRA